MRNVPLVFLEDISDVRSLTPDVSVVATTFESLDEANQDDFSLGLFRGLTDNGILSLTHNIRPEHYQDRHYMHHMVTRAYNLARMSITRDGRLKVNDSYLISKRSMGESAHERELIQRAGLYDNRIIRMEAQVA